MTTKDTYRPTGIDQRETDLRPVRPGHHTIPENDPATYHLWDDGRQTYTLQWGQGAYGSEHGTRLADLADTLIMAVEAIRFDRHKLTDPEFLALSLRSVRRLRSALSAVEDELLKSTRKSGPNGEPVMSLRYAASAMDVHHTTVQARIDRLNAGEQADWYGWLTQNSPASSEYKPAQGHDVSDAQLPDPAKRARIAEVLRKAGHLIAVNGWTPNKHYEVTPGKTPARSPLGLIGAIFTVMCGDPTGSIDPTVADEVSSRDVLDYLRNYLKPETSLAGWNSASGRTSVEVYKALWTAAQDLAPCE